MGKKFTDTIVDDTRAGSSPPVTTLAGLNNSIAAMASSVSLRSR